MPGKAYGPGPGWLRGSTGPVSVAAVGQPLAPMGRGESELKIEDASGRKRSTSICFCGRLMGERESGCDYIRPYCL